MRDWMPHTRPAQLAMARRWLDILPAKVQAWNIPAGMIERLEEVMVEAISTQDRAKAPKGRKGTPPE